MAFTQENVRDSVKAQLQDGAPFLTSKDLDTAIADGLRELNRDRPEIVTVDITGDDTQDLALPTEFVNGFSLVTKVEFPIDEARPRFLRRYDDWIIYENPTKSPTNRLLLPGVTPTATETVRLTIQTPFTVGTLTDNPFQALVYKTLQIAFKSLAAQMNQGVSSTIAADTVDRAALASNFLFLANEAKESYKKLVGLTEEVVAAHVVRDADLRFSHGEEFFWRRTSER